MLGKLLERHLGADFEMAIACRIVARYSLPKQVVRGGWLGDPESIDFNVGERIRFLPNSM